MIVSNTTEPQKVSKQSSKFEINPASTAELLSCRIRLVVDAEYRQEDLGCRYLSSLSKIVEDGKDDLRRRMIFLTSSR